MKTKNDYFFEQSAQKTYVWNETVKLVEGTLSRGETIDMMRDYWYAMKDYPKLKKFRKLSDAKGAQTDQGWSDIVSVQIAECIADMAYSKPSIYEQLGMESAFLKPGNVPILVMFEKQKSVALSIIDKFQAGHAFYRGQIPTIEVAHACSYLNKSMYSKGYIFIVADYDPSGESLYNSVKRKVKKFATNNEVEVIQVEYGDSPTTEFDNYKLTSNSTNRKWIAAGMTHGVEFNTPENINRGILGYLEQAMLRHVDKRVFVHSSHSTWFMGAYNKARKEDLYYYDLKERRTDLVRDLDSKIANRQKRFVQKVLNTPKMFDHFTDEERFKAWVESSDELQSDDDTEYFDELLGEHNPMTEKYRLYSLENSSELAITINSRENR